MNLVGLRTLGCTTVIVCWVPIQGVAQNLPFPPSSSGFTQAPPNSQFPPYAQQDPAFGSTAFAAVGNANSTLSSLDANTSAAATRTDSFLSAGRDNRVRPGPLPPPPGAPVPPLEPPTPSSKIVLSIKVIGNKATSELKVKSYIKSRTGRDFDPERVQADVRSLTQSGLFRDVRTFTQPQDGGLVLTYEVFERPTVNYVKFLGNKGIRDSTLLKKSELKVGDALNQYTIDDGRRKVEEFYHTKGFPQTTVDIFEGKNPTDQGVVYIINEGKLQRISKVEFEGNEIATDARLKTQVQSKPGFAYYMFGGKVDPKKISEDIEKITVYYRSLGYFRARIGRELIYDESEEWLTLKFIIDEGPRYIVRTVSIFGNEKFTTESLMDKMELKSSEYFNQAKMNRDISMLRDEYGSQGHIFADVQADPRFDEEPGVLDLVYKIKEGQIFRVGQVKVKIEGDYPHTRSSTVLNRLSLRPGDLVDIRKVRESESRLKSSNLFNTDPSKGDVPQVVVKPPDSLGDEEVVAEKPKKRAGSRTYRGQSPEEERQEPREPQVQQQPQVPTTPPARSWFTPWK